ncbi:LysR substrate-binding domain-containing protein [Tabrizicola sp.]|jgi:DNA-binding transcriptional LysR family regulator|uniref:LysR family transcriptional regulator n=1 Tax=Tabrizicola sp. TaxID=2005166 RepID=UPI001A41458C|nr:LysR substrate-binding domain-containing protein [Tabrizicola sp.]MBL9060930.1 LysR family transcriptional regulator [Tabrizicola sp.]
MNIVASSLAGQLRRLKPVHLRLLAELDHTGALGLAAIRIGIAQPAASRLLAEMEELLGLSLHERQGRGLRLTHVGQALARRAARIEIELTDAARDLAEAATGRAGVVRVGSVTGPALSLVLPVLIAIQRALPDFRAEVTVATSVNLCDLLRDGRLDFALARLSPGETQLEAQVIAGEPLSLVVRRGHPVLVRPEISIDDLLRHDWVMGDDETLLTQTVIARLSELGLPLPQRRISTSSFLFTLALLNQTDAIAPLATSVVDSFAGNPSVPFVSLPVDFGLSVAPFSLVTRTGAQMTPSAQRLIDGILAAV